MAIVIVLCIVVLAAFSVVYFTLRLGISPMPTALRVRGVVRDALPKHFDGSIYELGAGWGSLLPILAKAYPQHPIIAYERSWVPFMWTWLRIRCFGPVTAEIHCADFFESDLAGAGLVVCYLFPSAMDRLAAHLRRTLPPETWVISHTFALPGWQPIETRRATDIYRTPVYLYRT
ncbi:MAG: SAM-dependent methyltransferase [Chlamydiia bacterium]|nr:SAM-dependent methyltransferase [Chlamydiia bacterium]